MKLLPCPGADAQIEKVLGLGWPAGLRDHRGPFSAASLSFILVPGGWLGVGAPSTQPSLPSRF